MIRRTHRSKTGDAERSSTPARSNILQRMCACGAQAGMSGECEECASRQLTPLRSTDTETPTSSLVKDVLNAPGQPLDSDIRASMESRLGHDFSNVRVHTDQRAAESAASINASAYTVAEDVIFGAGEFDPKSIEGTKRLAHELTHVVQQTLLPNQRSASSEDPESEARLASEAVAAGQSARIITPATAGHAQRDKDKNALDAKAKAIIALAKDDKTKADERAVAIVKRIIKEYYAADEPLVDSIVYNNQEAGDGVKASQKFAKGSKSEESTGIIYVGDKFLAGVDESHFARRVLQVGHEIEHIHQWREGLAGAHKSNEREFLAFYHEALSPEKPGTGRIQHSTRLRLIDAALGNYYCLDSTQQTTYTDKKKELLDNRATEIAAGGKPDTADAPTACKKSS
jgi:Domain of unknown function (DUF4157)